MKNCCGGEQLAATITALASVIASDKSIQQLDLLAIAFNMLGDAIGVIAAQRSLCQPDSSGSTNSVTTIPE